MRRTIAGDGVVVVVGRKTQQPSTSKPKPKQSKSKPKPKPHRNSHNPPQQRWYSETLTRAVKMTYLAQRVTRNHREKIDTAIEHIKATIERELQAVAVDADVTVHSFGSTVTGLASRFRSDIDLCIDWPESASSDPDDNVKHRLKLLRNAAKKAGSKWSQLWMIPTARVPVLKMKGSVAPVGRLDIDICINRMMGVRNSELIRLYMDADPRVLPLTFVVKRWAKYPGLISDSANGRLSSYSIVLMVIFYLQLRGVLPPCIVNDSPETSFISSDDWIRSWCRDDTRANHNRQTMGELLVGLMGFYGHEFRPDTHVISICRGRETTRDELCQQYDPSMVLPKHREWWIEDPFEAATGYNPSQAVRRPAVADQAKPLPGSKSKSKSKAEPLTCIVVHEAFEHAWRVLTREKRIDVMALDLKSPYGNGNGNGKSR